MKGLGARIIRGKKPVYGPSTSSDVLRYVWGGPSAPTVAQGLKVEDLWSDSSASILKRCSSVSPVTFVSISEVGTPGAHASTHTTTDVVATVNTSNVGLCPQLDNDNTHFLDGQGSWAAPTATVVVSTILGSDNSYSGVTANCQAGENFTIGQAGYEKSDGLVWKAKGDSVNTMPSAFLATGAITVNTNGLFLMPPSTMRCDNVFEFAPGEILYVSNATAGLLTNTAPAASGDQVQVMGICKYNANTILWNPSYELVEI